MLYGLRWTNLVTPSSIQAFLVIRLVITKEDTWVLSLSKTYLLCRLNIAEKEIEVETY